MLLTLIKKEIVANVLSLRFMVTFVLFFVLIQVSIFVLSGEYGRDAATYEASRSAQRDHIHRLEGLEDFNRRFHDDIIDGEGIYDSVPPQPLSIFVHGLVNRLPVQVNTSFRNDSFTINREFYSNPLLALFAAPDYSYIVNIVVSLLSLLFVFDAICGEKERGTLKLLLSNSVPRDLVLLGKWIGGFVSLAVPFLVALFGGLIMIYWTGVIQLTEPFLVRFAWIAGVSLLYVLLFFALGMMISTLTHKASTALLVSLFVWVCWVLVVPNLAPVAARIVSPIPPRAVIDAEKIAIQQEGEVREGIFWKRGALDKVEKVRDEVRRDQQSLEVFYDTKMRTQIELARTLSRISPSASFTYLGSDLANTGIGIFSNFKRSFHRFDSEFKEWGEAWHKKFHSDGLDENWYQDGQLPTMNFADAHLDDTLNSSMGDILLMVIFNVLFFMLSYLFFLRYDVT